MQFSVVINTYNRRQSLQKTIESLQYQTYRNFEVVVVNGPSTDGTDKLLEAWADRIVCKQCPAVNISKSRNIGIAAASGDVVAFIDDDAIPEPDWLAKLSEPYSDSHVAGVGGIVWDHTGFKLQYRFSLCDRLGRTKFTSVQPNYRDLHSDPDYFVYLQGTNASFRRSVLEQVGGFDEEIEYFHDETDLAARINDLGMILVPLTDGAVHHKYLASHLRTPERTILEPYPIVKNSYYFGLTNGRVRYRGDEIVAHLTDFSSGVQHHGISALKNGRMTQEQFDHFTRRVAEGQRDGLTRGYSGERKLTKFQPADSSQFKTFPTLQTSTERLVTCFISNEYPPDNFGGIGRFTRDLAEGMAACGHQVHVITRSSKTDHIDWENGVWLHRLRPQTERVCNSELHAIPYKWNLLHCATVYNEVLRLNSRFKLDIVSSPLWSSEGLICELDSRLPTVISLMTSQKTLGQIDERLGSQKVWQQQVALERQTVRNARYIHSISHAILEKTTADYGPIAGQASVTYLGVRDESKLHSRRRPTDDGEFRLLYVGRLEPRKGTDVLLSAMEQLCKENLKIRLVLVGKDNAENSYEHALAKRSGHLIREGRIRFRGPVSDAELYQEYADADVFVLPSRFESFGLVLLEAMSFGLPLIASKVGGIEEIVDHNVNGLLVEPGSVQELVSSIRHLAMDSARSTRMGTESRALYLAKWSIDRAVENTIKTYSGFATHHRLSEKNRLVETPLDAQQAVAERLCKLSLDEPQLVNLSIDSANALIKPLRSTEILSAVLSGWYRSKPRFVKKIFKSILGRAAEPSTVEYFVNQLKKGTSRKDIILHIANTDEARQLDLATDWLDKLPKTELIEKMPIVFPVWAAVRQVPTIWQPTGLLRTELRRRRRRRAAQATKQAA